MEGSCESGSAERSISDVDRNKVRNAGFAGTDEEFDAVRDGIASAFAKVDAAADSRCTSSPMRAANLVSVVQAGGSATVPTLNIVWRSFPVDPGRPVAYEAVAEAALRGDAPGATVLHRGETRDLGIVEHAALAAALGF